MLGVARLVLDFVYPAPKCGDPDHRPGIVSAINFTYFSAILFGISAIVAIVLSFTTARPDYEKVNVDGLS